MRIRNLIGAAVTAIILASCATPKNYNYLQELQNGQQLTTPTDGTIRLQPNDMITILVKSKNVEMANIFNKGLITNVKAGLADQSLYTMGYTVDPEGNIDFPVAGKIHVGGLSRYEAQEAIKNKLIDSELLKDANVTVDLMNLSYTVMGEVNKPGNYKLDKDADKGCILHSRILWFFSNAYLTLKNEEDLTYAKHAYEFIKAHCIDSEYGGVFWSVTADGQPADQKINAPFQNHEEHEGQENREPVLRRRCDALRRHRGQGGQHRHIVWWL